MSRVHHLICIMVLVLVVTLTYQGCEGRRAPPVRHASWLQLQSELQDEVEAGLDEQQLNVLEASTVSQEATQCLLQQPRQCDTSSPARVFLDVSIDVGTVGSQAQIGRLTIDLFNATAPRTVENFLTICRATKKGFTYQNNRFHRIITGFMAQGGDITRGDGRGGKSIYGTTFPDETFACHHVCKGSLSMANAGPDTNGSQFFLTFASTPWLDGKHVVFGQLVDGWSTLQSMEEAGTNSGRTTADVTIVKCTVA